MAGSLCRQEFQNLAVVRLGGSNCALGAGRSCAEKARQGKDLGKAVATDQSTSRGNIPTWPHPKCVVKTGQEEPMQMGKPITELSVCACIARFRCSCHGHCRVPANTRHQELAVVNCKHRSPASEVSRSRLSDFLLHVDRQRSCSIWSIIN
jgi:hypothetical protein